MLLLVLPQVRTRRLRTSTGQILRRGSLGHMGQSALEQMEEITHVLNKVAFSCQNLVVKEGFLQPHASYRYNLTM